MRISIRKFLVEKTNRDGLLYKNLENFYFNISGFKNFLRRGHIIRRMTIRKYLERNKKPKLHLGCDTNIINGFLNADLQRGEIFIDVRKKLPFRNNTFNYIYHSHLLEHIFKREANFFLGECRRILKPNGVLRICIPDLDKVINILWGKKNKKNIGFLENEQTMFYKKNIVTEMEFMKCVYLNNIMHKSFGHKYLYDFEYLKFLCKKNGLKKCKRVNFNESKYETFKGIDGASDNDKAKKIISMVLECEK